MKKRISAPHIRVYNTLEDDINSQMDSLTYDFGGLTSASIVLTHGNNLFKAHLLVNGRKLHVSAEARGDLLSSVIDCVFAKAERQLRKEFQKRRSHRSKGVSEIERNIRDRFYDDATIVIA